MSRKEKITATNKHFYIEKVILTKTNVGMKTRRKMKYSLKGRNSLNFAFYDILESDQYPSETRKP